ncbi:GntR family transcriptional regulator [Pseudoroseicyclus sp. CXY001]|uniref:GntR family transcriptional regulator n=1 Tax=Pseudoroseicyclus sp. CXY001 TaxID=3242492 RepID=UPI00358DAB0E
MKQHADAMNDFRVERVAAPLRNQVIEAIRNSIIAGHFEPGERLLERRLCEMTGVSRTLVREALRQLESEGLIEVVPHRGPRVAVLDPDMARDIYLVRSQLEGLAAALFAERATSRNFDAIRAAFERLKSVISEDDPIVRVEAKNAFYVELINGAGNRALGPSLNFLNSRIVLLRATSLQAPGRLQESVKELGALVDALEARDSEAARAAAQRHVANAAEIALQFLKV